MAIAQRRCLICGYVGEMKTWLRHHNLPQFIALVLLISYVVPGLIFIGWAYGKYKCPKCGALAKNTSDIRSAAPVSVQGPAQPSRKERSCPWCAEPILLQAKVCKHCGKEVAPSQT